MHRLIINNSDARDALLRGVEKVATAVALHWDQRVEM